MKYSLYSDSALRDINHILSVITNPLNAQYTPRMEKHYRFCKKYLPRAVKFKLPQIEMYVEGGFVSGGFWDHFPDDVTSPMKDIVEGDLNLPYGVTALEYVMKTDDTTTQNILLLVNTGDNAIAVYRLYTNDSVKQWSLFKYAVTLSFKDGQLILTFPYTHYDAKYSDEENVVREGVATQMMLSIVRCFIDALNCLNVEHKTITIPKSIRGQAKKQHKNYYDYRELVLIPTDTQSTSGEPTGSTKRTHLRRGHIRRLKSGKTVWVNAHIVKPDAVDQGLVGKHYRL